MFKPCKKIMIGITLLGVSISMCGCNTIKLFQTISQKEENTVLMDDQKGRYAHVEEKLGEIDALLNNYYLNEDEIDTQTMEDGILKGYVDALGEKYTTYYSAEEYQSLMESTNGEYEGVGVVVSQNMDTKVITVVQVFENGPAYGAGMKAGDIIYKVGDMEVTGMDLSLVVKDIKGESGTPVTLTMYRPSEDEYIEMTMNREKIEQPTVAHEMLDQNMGYIRISSFDVVTEKQFTDAIDSLTAQGMKGLIIDLRDNPGGVLETVCHMLDRVLPAEKLLVYTEDKNQKRNEIYTENPDEINIPMVVITNGNSASASEIFTAALKDYDKAVIVGKTTFGKGIVQTIIPLSDGSAIKMTTSKYYTPSGVCIHEIGVEPDIEVDQVNDGEEDTVDEQLEAAKKALLEQL